MDRQDPAPFTKTPYCSLCDNTPPSDRLSALSSFAPLSALSSFASLSAMCASCAKEVEEWTKPCETSTRASWELWAMLEQSGTFVRIVGP